MNHFELIFDEKSNQYFVKYKNQKDTNSMVSVSYLIRNNHRLKYEKVIHIKILNWLIENHPEYMI